MSACESSIADPRGLLQGVHLLPVGGERGATSRRNLVARRRYLALEVLADRDVAGLLQLAGLAAQVALGQPGRRFEEPEIDLCRSVQHRQNDQAGRLVDDSVDRQ